MRKMGNRASEGTSSQSNATLTRHPLLNHPHTTVIVKVKIVSCHPGWTLTDGVKAAYGDKRSSLEVRYGQSIFSLTTAVRSAEY